MTLLSTWCFNLKSFTHLNPIHTPSRAEFRAKLFAQGHTVGSLAFLGFHPSALLAPEQGQKRRVELPLNLFSINNSERQHRRNWSGQSCCPIRLKYNWDMKEWRETDGRERDRKMRDRGMGMREGERGGGDPLFSSHIRSDRVASEDGSAKSTSSQTPSLNQNK